MKTYIDVIAYYTKDGKLKPLYVIWDNKMKYCIDHIVEVRRAASLKSGGSGIRYTCKIHGNIRYLFFDVDRWFIEK